MGVSEDEDGTLHCKYYSSMATDTTLTLWNFNAIPLNDNLICEMKPFHRLTFSMDQFGGGFASSSSSPWTIQLRSSLLTITVLVVVALVHSAWGCFPVQFTTAQWQEIPRWNILSSMLCVTLLYFEIPIKWRAALDEHFWTLLRKPEGQVSLYIWQNLTMSFKQISTVNNITGMWVEGEERFVIFSVKKVFKRGDQVLLKGRTGTLCGCCIVNTVPVAAPIADGAPATSTIEPGKPPGFRDVCIRGVAVLRSLAFNKTPASSSSSCHRVVGWLFESVIENSQEGGCLEKLKDGRVLWWGQENNFVKKSSHNCNFH